jgi:hypothetical protein
VTVSTIEELSGTPAVAPLSRITAIDGKPVRARHPGFGSWPPRLRARDGQVVALTIVDTTGRIATHRIAASDRYFAQADRGVIKFYTPAAYPAAACAW